MSRWRARLRQVRSIKIRYKLAIATAGPLILYSANFYYKIGNFLLKPGDTKRTREKNDEKGWCARDRASGTMKRRKIMKRDIQNMRLRNELGERKLMSTYNYLINFKDKYCGKYKKVKM